MYRSSRHITVILFAACLLASACFVGTSQADPKPVPTPVATPGYLLSDPFFGDRPILDFSYAGYALCPESIAPNNTLPVIPVRDHGAIPNDGKSDREAIAAAIKAAENADGAIVQFESGVYDINPEAGRRDGIVIHSDHVVLRGVQRTPGSNEETVLWMEKHLEPRDPKKMWSTPNMIQFVLDPKLNKRPRLARVTSATRRGGFTVTVDDASKLKAGDFATLKMKNPAANEIQMAGLTPWNIWTSTIQKGIEVRERHRIAEIDGLTITFAEPIHTDINADHGWEVTPAPMAHGWVVEDITFRGDCPEPFVHHKNAAHDSGWSMLGFTRGYAPVLRRCRFIDISGAAVFSACYGATAIDNTIEGRQGHNSIGASFYSYGTLIAFCDDLVKKGTFHGFASSKGAAGTVIYRCKNSNRGFDWHASGPYATLIDACSGGLIGNGGAHVVLPNHLQDLVFWNFKQTSGKVFKNYQWWEPQRGNERYSGAKVVMPILVGFHGPSASTFDPGQCLLIESHGHPVHPTSLFEAQLKRRTGVLPHWITDRIDDTSSTAINPEHPEKPQIGSTPFHRNVFPSGSRPANIAHSAAALRTPTPNLSVRMLTPTPPRTDPISWCHGSCHH